MSRALHTISKLSIFTVWIPSSYRLHVESHLQAKMHLKLKTKSCVPTWSIKALRCWTSLQLQDASSFSWHWQIALVGASSLIKITLLAFSRLMQWSYHHHRCFLTTKDSAEMFVVMLKVYKPLSMFNPVFLFGFRGRKRVLLQWGYPRGFIDWRQGSENIT